MVASSSRILCTQSVSESSLQGSKSEVRGNAGINPLETKVPVVQVGDHNTVACDEAVEKGEARLGDSTDGVYLELIPTASLEGSKPVASHADGGIDAAAR